ncbi:MAG: hydantoinase/oxoprolinase family protein [Clostridia bacterium]|nr:hydantoinase/oxoprolinase family protein [Clostridia bacterium]
MGLGIGIDTGGTYTDAVVYDFDTARVMASGKARTTKEDLSLGIGRALDSLPAELVKRAEIISLSTTLATNACVEDKGGRARLVMMGTNQKTLKWVHADQKYGLNVDDILCVETHGSFDGKVVDHPDWAAIIAENDAFLRQAEALGIVELNAMHNGGVCEAEARDALRGAYDVPLVMASELVSGLNIMERGATALLNARLLPVVDQFLKAVDKALKERGLGALRVIVRSDGSLMVEDAAKKKPVETILSGPAASVMGAKALADCKSAVVVDMGGTTTDISIIRDGAPQMSGGISVGGWRTQVNGVFIDTVSLGGDTRIFIDGQRLVLGNRRVEPLCAAASRWPKVREELERLAKAGKAHTQPVHEFLYLVRESGSDSLYTDAEKRIMDSLRGGPQMIGGEALGLYGLDTERLEREGLVMRCGLTPTDIMHITGDYKVFDDQASRLAARHFLQSLPQYEDTDEDMSRFCAQVYDLVEEKLFTHVARVLIESRYPDIYKGGVDAQTQALISEKWKRRHEADPSDFFRIGFDVGASLVGIGAPIHLFLPDVAAALGAKCSIPEHSEVANAVGAVVADVFATVEVEIRCAYGTDGVMGYTVHASDDTQWYETFEQAMEGASAAAVRLARAEARRRGAMGELTTRVRHDSHAASDRDGARIDLGTTVIATASGRML